MAGRPGRLWTCGRWARYCGTCYASSAERRSSWTPRRTLRWWLASCCSGRSYASWRYFLCVSFITSSPPSSFLSALFSFLLLLFFLLSLSDIVLSPTKGIRWKLSSLIYFWFISASGPSIACSHNNAPTHNRHITTAHNHR